MSDRHTRERERAALAGDRYAFLAMLAAELREARAGEHLNTTPTTWTFQATWGRDHRYRWAILPAQWEGVAFALGRVDPLGRVLAKSYNKLITFADAGDLMEWLEAKLITGTWMRLAEHEAAGRRRLSVKGLRQRIAQKKRYIGRCRERAYSEGGPSAWVSKRLVAEGELGQLEAELAALEAE